MVAEAAADHPTPVLGAIGPRYRARVLVLALIACAISVITGPANSFVFLFAQDVVHQAGYVSALMVAAAGVAGLVGLLCGRWLADTIGRRPTGACAMVAIACSGALLYSGSRQALVAGYILGVLSGSVLAPAVGSLLTELFPTSVRASATGWWSRPASSARSVGSWRSERWPTSGTGLRPRLTSRSSPPPVRPGSFGFSPRPGVASPSRSGPPRTFSRR